MADHTITVANVLTFVGMDAASLWGTAVWGTDTWGAGSLGMEEVVGKLVTNTVTAASTERFDVVFNGPVANTLTLTSAQLSELVFFVGSNTLTLSSDITSELLTNGIWSYVFPGGVTDHDDQVSTTYTATSSQSSTYSTPSTPSTTWS